MIYFSYGKHRLSIAGPCTDQQVNFPRILLIILGIDSFSSMGGI